MDYIYLTCDYIGYIVILKWISFLFQWINFPTFGKVQVKTLMLIKNKSWLWIFDITVVKKWPHFQEWLRSCADCVTAESCYEFLIGSYCLLTSKWLSSMIVVFTSAVGCLMRSERFAWSGCIKTGTNSPKLSGQDKELKGQIHSEVGRKWVVKKK